MTNMIYTNPYEEKLYKVRHAQTIKDIINQGARLFADRPAFLAKDVKGGEYKEISYKELKADVDALGTALLSIGLSGARIAIIGENSYQWITSYFAVVNGVGTIVPLDKELSRDEIYNLLQIAECQAVFYSPAYEKHFKNYDIPYKFKIELYNGKKHIFGEEKNSWKELRAQGRMLLAKGNVSYAAAEVPPDKMRIMLFTSGTTDAAKAVMLCHRNIVSNAHNISRIVKLRKDDRTLSILPIHHTFESTIGIMTVLFQGGSIAFYEGLKYINKNLAEAKCTVLVGVPLIFESIYQKIWKQAEKSGKAKALRSAIKFNKTMKAMGIDIHERLFKSVYAPFGGRLRLLITGAAGIEPDVIRGFQDLGFEVAQGYGLTETSPLVSGTPDFTDRYKKSGSVGPVIPEGELQIIDKNEDGIGEIIYRGPNIMLGYYNMPEKTAEVLKDGWFYTGDLGFADEQGWIYITGRKKNVIVTKTGKNIYPEEIEEHVSRIKYVEECMVYGMESDDEGEGTIVAVQIRPDYEIIHQEFGEAFDADNVYALLKRCIAEANQQMPNYKRVRHVMIRDIEFIKTTTKKIKRQENIKGFK